MTLKQKFNVWWLTLDDRAKRGIYVASAIVVFGITMMVIEAVMS